MLAFYVLLALYSRAWMGHWPRYYEYLTVFDSPLFRIIGGAFLLWGAVSLILAPVSWGVVAWRAWPGRRTAERQATVFVAAWILFILLVAADPYGFTSFLID